MLRELDIKNEEDSKAVSRVVTGVFSDGVTNWGRIVTFISFGAFVAKHLKSINQESCVDPLAESLTDVLVKTKRDWLIKQKGWVSLKPRVTAELEEREGEVGMVTAPLQSQALS